MRARSPLSFVLAIALVASIAVLGWMVPLTRAAGGLCASSKVVYDYRYPLKQIPLRRKLSESGKIGFGPGMLRLYPPHSDVLVAGEGIYLPGGRVNAGVGQAARDFTRASLGWFVTSALERVGSKGSTARVLKRKTQYIDRVGSFSRQNFGFRAGLAVGIYRLHLSFQNKNRRLLGQRETLFRVVKARSELRLGISSSRLTPGSTGQYRVENAGSVSTAFSYKYRIWVISDGVRMGPPIEPSAVSGDLPVALPGMASRCVPFDIPPDLAAGDYVLGVAVDNALIPKHRFILARLRVTS